MVVAGGGGWRVVAGGGGWWSHLLGAQKRGFFPIIFIYFILNKLFQKGQIEIDCKIMFLSLGKNTKIHATFVLHK